MMLIEFDLEKIPFFPDVVITDGGAGQNDHNVWSSLHLVAIDSASALRKFWAGAKN